ncbi:hypothetical protein E3N88_22736 [Mikania micrantha]|uniref:Uncharacterized protein n=1 Tax=Mikania micrantha TaxID=192012 RepID=A0A5N6NDY8_9ASTR|nr:hypothetical protein E3N88_22736 [Mikania micrantha]
MYETRRKRPWKNQGSSTLVDESPLRDYVSRIEKQGGGGTWKFKCKLCSEIREGSYSRKETTGDKLEMNQLEDAYEEKKAKSKAKEVGLPCKSGVGFEKRKGNS